MRHLTSLFFIFFCFQLSAQSLHQDLYSHYESIKEQSISERRIKHSDIVPLIQKLKGPFRVEQVGNSVEGRAIFTVKIGDGPVKVLLWSQMHGDEPTATMALMDIFNFLGSSDRFDALRQHLLSELTICFIPMLNPDGAEKFTRRNALGIDINRDALRLQSPESQVLKRIRDEMDADWGFNLHDQGRYYAAGLSDNTASISFLAPAYNYEKNVNEVRSNAMLLIAKMNEVLQQYIPGKVGRYNDDFEPRAFGDNIQKWGTSTILIETGSLKGDLEKQYLRKLNFVMLMTALDGIAEGSFKAFRHDDYEAIPFNESNGFHDLILRQVQFEKENKWYMVDIGFRRSEAQNEEATDFYFRSRIQDLGDLSVYAAYEEVPPGNYRAIPGKIYPKAFKNLQALKRKNISGLLQKGYTDFHVEELPEGMEKEIIPFRLLLPEKEVDNHVVLGKNPSLLLQKNGRTDYIIINGFLFDWKNDKRAIEQRINQLR